MRTSFHVLLVILCAMVAAPFSVASAEEAAPDKVVQFRAAMAEQLQSIEVEPKKIELHGPFDYQQMLVRGVLASGQVVDLTRDIERTLSSELVTISPTGLIRPAVDGQATLTLRYGKQSLELPVVVAGAQQPYEPDFVRDVMPVLSKAGCNAGTCHGAQDGKNGFKLSLRGYDPQYDHRALVDDIAGRRFNRAAPEKSLMLLKPSGVVPHEGGVVIAHGDPYYRILRDWIKGGVKLNLDTPRVVGIEMLPRDVVIPLPQMSQQMKVIATYADGSRRDVTAETFIEPSDIEILSIDSQGLVSALRRGEAAALARYEGAYAAARVVVMGDREGYAWRETPAFNYIDELVYAKQRQVKVLPSELCTDAEFIRRVSIDLTGLPPTAEAVTAFLADTRETRVKRDELVDALIGSPEYIAHWTKKWGDMLQVNAEFLGKEGAEALQDWIESRLEANTPYDQFCHEVITASGSTRENPPAAYWKVHREPAVAMENTTQLFLAIRFNCNKCHDHPFERWTQDQYYEMAAFFAQVERKEDPDFKDKKIGGTKVEAAVPLVEIITDGGKGEMKHDRTGEVTPPEFPFEHGDMPSDDGSRREKLAEWITSPENPYFAKSYVNRIWSYLTGVGLIEPIDDIRAGNPPSNPELLDRMTEEFISSGFDVQQIMATICKSRTYQLSIKTNEWNETDTVNYTHRLPQRLPAEVLYDAIYRVTGSTRHLPGLPAGARAAEIIDPTAKTSDGFLDMFGRPPRETSCECERSDSILLGPVMNLINGPTLANAITDKNNRIAELVRMQPDDREVVKALFLSILNRPATEAEIEAGAAAMRVDLFSEELASAQARLAETTAKLDAAQAEWETTLDGPVWTPLELSELKSNLKTTFTRQDDGSYLVEGELGIDTYQLAGQTPMQSITGIRLEVFADDRLPGKGPGRPPNGNFVLNELTATAAPLADTAIEPKPLGLGSAQADFSQDGYAVAGAVDGNAASGWAVSPQLGKNHTAIFAVEGDANYAGGTRLTFNLAQQYRDKKHLIGRFRISVTDSPRPHTLGGPPPQIAAALAVPVAERTPQQAALLANHHREQSREYIARRDRVNQLISRGVGNVRLVGAQDLAWALINSPSFLFNR